MNTDFLNISSFNRLLHIATHLCAKSAFMRVLDGNLNEREVCFLFSMRVTVA